MATWETAVVQRLAQAGHKLGSYKTKTPKQIYEQIIEGAATLIDVRNQNEWEKGHLPNAHHLMLGYLQPEAAQFICDKPIIVQCQSGARSAVGASILKAMGATDVTNLKGGYIGWRIAGLPMVQE